MTLSTAKYLKDSGQTPRYFSAETGWPEVNRGLLLVVTGYCTLIGGALLGGLLLWLAVAAHPATDWLLPGKAAKDLLPVGILTLLATAGLSYTLVLRGQWRRYWLVSAGLVLLLFFIVARATTFHHVDSMLGWRLGVLRVNHVLELAALGLVSLGAWRWRRDPASGHQVVLA